MEIWLDKLSLKNRDKIIYIFYIKSQKNKSIFVIGNNEEKKYNKYVKLYLLFKKIMKGSEHLMLS